MAIFEDPLHDEWGSWTLGFTPYGGGDVGEVEWLATQVEAGDDDSFFEAFDAFAKGLIAEGDAAAADKRDITARDCFLRAAAYLGVGYHPLFGTPVDPRLVDAFHLQMETFAKAMALLDVPGEAIQIPYEGTQMPGWLLRNPRRPGDRLPTIIVGGGWDSTMVENHLGMGVAALQRDYHVVLFDGPGQGRLLVDEGLTLRHDWEHVVTPVVDVLVGMDEVDSERIVYQPWSLGGYFAPRVAAYEHRLAAAVADPGQMSIGGKLIAGLRLMGLTPDQEAKLPELDADFAAKALGFIESNRSLNWSMLKRAYWTNGATDLQTLIGELMRWTLTPEILAGVKAPMLVTSAEGDRASTDTDELYAALRGPKARIHFTAAEGAGMHCEMLNRSLANRRILDWIDSQVASQS